MKSLMDWPAFTAAEPPAAADNPPVTAAAAAAPATAPTAAASPGLIFEEPEANIAAMESERQARAPIKEKPIAAAQIGGHTLPLVALGRLWNEATIA